MIGVTMFGIFLTPVFYVLLRGLTGNKPFKQHGAEAEYPIQPRHELPAGLAPTSPARDRERANT
jgi:multidrug efflux pump